MESTLRTVHEHSIRTEKDAPVRLVNGEILTLHQLKKRDVVQTFSSPTLYNGTRYRSKLEAKWARFFDTHGMRFEYELEGYNFGNTPYLPDFYFPDLGTFVEVKGVMQEIDRNKIEALAEHHSVVVCGTDVDRDFGILATDGNSCELEPITLAKCLSCEEWGFQRPARPSCYVCLENRNPDLFQFHPSKAGDILKLFCEKTFCDLC
jgi:hypothetical protein